MQPTVEAESPDDPEIEEFEQSLRWESDSERRSINSTGVSVHGDTVQIIERQEQAIVPYDLEGLRDYGNNAEYERPRDHGYYSEEVGKWGRSKQRKSSLGWTDHKQDHRTDEEERRYREEQAQRDHLRDEEQHRHRERRHRERKREERKLLARRQQISELSMVDWTWFSQMDVMAGFWATPWGRTLPFETCNGSISVALEAIQSIVSDSCLQFIDSYRLKGALDWANSGGSTWPSYVVNARGGVVVQGKYISAKFPGFAKPIARIELASNQTWQTDPYPMMDIKEEQIRVAELMHIDSWLSIGSRAPEIVDGKSELLRNLPALLQYLLVEFQDDFASITRSANEGGLQMIQEVTETLKDALDDERLSTAEQIFTLVAMLRTVKVGKCVKMGPDTSLIQDSLDNDIRVWLV